MGLATSLGLSKFSSMNKVRGPENPYAVKHLQSTLIFPSKHLVIYTKASLNSLAFAKCTPLEKFQTGIAIQTPKQVSDPAWRGGFISWLCSAVAPLEAGLVKWMQENVGQTYINNLT